MDHTRPDLPPFPRVLFRKAPLVQVLGQVRFPALPAFSEPSYIEKLRRELRWEYPKSSKTEQLSLTLSPKHAEHFPGPTLWRFSSLDDGWSAVLAEDALTLEVRGYTSIEEFVERFERVLVAIEKVLEPPLRTRVGLRYINEFRYPGVKTIADWRPLIRPEVLGLAATADDIFGGGVVVPTRQDVHVNLPDGTLVIRHGLLTGTTVEPASGDDVPREPFYLLDMDYFNIKTEELDRQVVGELFRRYNDTMYRFFRWVMLGPLYDSLEPGHDG